MSGSEPYTAAVADVLDGLGIRSHTLPPAIGPLRPGMRLQGPAFPVAGRPAEGSDYDASLRRLLRMLGDVPPGHVPVYATGDRACAQFGELSATALAAKGCPGVVLDGGTRDVDLLVEQGFATFCRLVTPLDSVTRWEVTGWGDAVEIGGVRVAAGDWVVADADGVVVVPGERTEEVLARAREVAAVEDEVREAVRAGVPPLEAYERYGKF